MDNITKVGIGVMIWKDGKVLLGKRRGSHGEGTYAFPGGHMEYMESFTDCVKRELEEECGLKIKNLRFVYVANVKIFDPKHYLHITLAADWEGGEPEIREPDKCESWDWFDPEDLHTPLFPQSQVSFLVYKNGTQYYDSDDFNQILNG